MHTMVIQEASSGDSKSALSLAKNDLYNLFVYSAGPRKNKDVAHRPAVEKGKSRLQS